MAGQEIDHQSDYGEKKPKIIISMIIALLFFVATSSFFVFDYFHLKRAGMFHAHHPRSHLFGGLGQMSPPDLPLLITVDGIRPWMTFAYIDHSFSLPPDYLKDKLHITNSAYPNVSLGRIARDQKLDPNAFILLVKNGVSAYSQKSTTP